MSHNYLERNLSYFCLTQSVRGSLYRQRLAIGIRKKWLMRIRNLFFGKCLSKNKANMTPNQ